MGRLDAGGVGMDVCDGVGMDVCVMGWGGCDEGVCDGTLG